MKEAVELAHALLGPRNTAQQIDGPLKRPLEFLARTVIEADKKIKDLEYQLKRVPQVGSYEKQGPRLVDTHEQSQDG